MPPAPPLPLPRTAEDGPSFDRLVESVTRDVRPRAVLDDWVSQGIATIGADDRISLSADAFLPQQGREEQLFYFARNVHGPHRGGGGQRAGPPGRPPSWIAACITTG